MGVEGHQPMGLDVVASKDVVASRRRHRPRRPPPLPPWECGAVLVTRINVQMYLILSILHAFCIFEPSCDQ